ncbi:MAG: Uma2 family endonuclease [Nocardioidaceae bacterium]
MAVQPVAHRFSVDEYHGTSFDEDSRVELLAGEIIDMAPIGSRHAACVKRTAELFHTHLAGRAIVGVQDPVRLGDFSEPQPDIALLRPRSDYYSGAHPGAGDVLLVVEVGDSTAAWDAEHKLPAYASAGVAEVWLVDLPAGSVEVCRLPHGRGYQDRRVLSSSDQVSPAAFNDIVLEVASILPRLA